MYVNASKCAQDADRVMEETKARLDIAHESSEELRRELQILREHWRVIRELLLGRNGSSNLCANDIDFAEIRNEILKLQNDAESNGCSSESDDMILKARNRIIELETEIAELTHLRRENMALSVQLDQLRSLVS
jgi:hypothetical protein